MSDTGTPAANWYPDPEVPGGFRYWDGAQWTEHRQAPPTSSTQPGVASVHSRGMSTGKVLVIGIGSVVALGLIGAVASSIGTAGKPSSQAGGVPLVSSASPTSAKPSPSATATKSSAPPKPTVVTPPPAPRNWYPKGYREIQDGIAVRWLKSKEYRCDFYGGSCWGALVIARDGCPNSLYVELSIEDRRGNAIGFTNDVAGATDPGQKAKMVFTTFDKDADAASISKVSCY